MIEGLWTMSFQTDLAVGNGVVIFETSRAFGGDSDFYYLGSYEVDRNKIKAKVTITNYGRHNISVFGIVNPGSSIELIIEGEINDQRIGANGYIKGNPSARINCLLVKRSELPG